MSFFNQPNKNMVFNQQQQQQQDQSLQDINLDNPSNNPEDSVQSIEWMPQMLMNPIFSTAGWDGSIKIYETNYQNKMISQKMNFKYTDPILCQSWKNDGSMIFAGCADNTVRVFDINSQQLMELGRHDAAITCIHWIEQMFLLMTFSLDKQIRFWNLQTKQCVAQIPLDYKAYCSTLNQNMVLAGLSQDKIAMIDLQRVMQNPSQKIIYNESPLQSQITCVALQKDNSVLGVGSVDGRANLSYIQKGQHILQYIHQLNNICH